MNEAFIELCRLRVRLVREGRMTPKVRGVHSALSKLKHALDSDAEKLANRIEKADQRREAVFSKSHESLSSTEKDLDEIENFLGDMEGHNGGPSGTSDEGSEDTKQIPPRSSEVASR